MGMRSWSIPAGQWFGINVRVHLTFFFLLLFVWMTESKGADPTNTFLRSLAFTGIVMAAVLAHELGHHYRHQYRNRRKRAGSREEELIAGLHSSRFFRDLVRRVHA